MAEPTLDQRTPVCRLKFESEDTRNYNWSKLDDVIGRAFTPDSPLQLPPLPPPDPATVTNAMLAVGATVTSTQEDISVPTTIIPLIVEVELARVDYSTARIGPLLVTGVISLSLANTGASAAPAAFQIQGRMPGAIRIVRFFATVNPGSKLPFAAPIAFVVQPTFAASPFVSISCIKTVGPDATVVLQAEDGRLTVTELG